MCDNSGTVGASSITGSVVGESRVRSGNSSVSSGRTCWSLRKPVTDNSSVANDNSQNVVVTSINTLDVEDRSNDLVSNDRPSSVAFLNQHQKISSSSLSLATLDSSRYFKLVIIIACSSFLLNWYY